MFLVICVLTYLAIIILSMWIQLLCFTFLCISASILHSRFEDALLGGCAIFERWLRFYALYFLIYKFRSPLDQASLFDNFPLKLQKMYHFSHIGMYMIVCRVYLRWYVQCVTWDINSFNLCIPIGVLSRCRVFQKNHKHNQ